eukprot:SAG11_NODE_29034_length_315_cov_0.722222_1_plen_20_part_01
MDSYSGDIYKYSVLKYPLYS